MFCVSSRPERVKELATKKKEMPALNGVSLLHVPIYALHDCSLVRILRSNSGDIELRDVSVTDRATDTIVFAASFQDARAWVLLYIKHDIAHVVCPAFSTLRIGVKAVQWDALERLDCVRMTRLRSMR